MRGGGRPRRAGGATNAVTDAALACARVVPTEPVLLLGVRRCDHSRLDIDRMIGPGGVGGIDADVVRTPAFRRGERATWAPPRIRAWAAAESARSAPL